MFEENAMLFFSRFSIPEGRFRRFSAVRPVVRGAGRRVLLSGQGLCLCAGRGSEGV